MTQTRPRVAILGAGPIGLEAALYARTLGLEVVLHEAETVGHHPLSWGQVTLFTPWPLNVSALGERRLKATSGFSLDPERRPSGKELVEQYLVPLSRLPELAGVIREGSRAVAIARSGMIKSEGIGDGTRDPRPFRILLDGPGGERVETAEVVLDATGIFGQPNPLGADGIPAPGERALAGRLDTGLPDVAGRDRERFAGRRVLVVGGGLSAATTVTALAALPDTEVIWVTRGTAPPLAEIPADPLPARRDLIRAANRLAAAPPPGFRYLPGASVRGLAEAGTELAVSIAGAGDPELRVDRVVLQTGFRPDLALHRELQVHTCYATEGPMKLAASLLGAGTADCMAETGFGPDSLRNPEPGFFVLGHKSYGRNPHFLLRTGRDQVVDIFRLVTGDRDLDLYRAETAGV